MFTWIKKHLPSVKEMMNRPSLKWAKAWFQKRPYLWKFTKHSVAAGFALSLFVAFLPLPFEMLLITCLAMLFHGNLYICILSTWITNPFTLIPANYFSYLVGAWIIRSQGTYLPAPRLEFHWRTWHMFWNDASQWITSLGWPYIVGLPIVSITSALTGYFLVYSVWTLVELTKKKL